MAGSLLSERKNSEDNLLDRGRVVCHGSFADCVKASGGDISDVLQATRMDDDDDDDKGEVDGGEISTEN